MNVLRGRVVDGAFDLGDGQQVPLTDGEIPAEWTGRELDLGIRPEHLLRDGDGDGVGGFAPIVEVVEPVGNEVFVNLQHGAHALVARLPPGELPQPGATLPLRLAPRRAHYFDPASGLRVDP
jgi:multiple sugar transport system ATP-binding protein